MTTPELPYARLTNGLRDLEHLFVVSPKEVQPSHVCRNPPSWERRSDLADNHPDTRMRAAVEHQQVAIRCGTQLHNQGQFVGKGIGHPSIAIAQPHPRICTHILKTRRRMRHQMHPRGYGAHAVMWSKA